MIRSLNDRGVKIESLYEETANPKHIRVYDKTNDIEILPPTPLKGVIEIDNSYYMDMMFAVTDDETEKTEVFKSPKPKDVLLEIHSRALGDQIAWIPICDLFQKKHECIVSVACKFPELFQPFYPNIKFTRQYFKGEVLPDPIPTNKFIDRYILGYAVKGFHNLDGLKVSPVDCRGIGLQDVGCYQLGIEPQDVQPNMTSNIKEPIVKGKYVVITTCGAGDFKFWHYPDGWKEIVKYFNKKGLKVVHVGKTSYKLKDTINKKGNLEWNKLMNIIEHGELFLGLSSGLSWLAWALGQKVFTINGITADFAEFDHYKIQNKEVCHGCWNDLSFTYDNSNAEYCPRNKDFECTKEITPKMVIDKVESVL